MKPNFDEMSKAELKAYVLSHRDDDEAIRVLFSRRNPPDSEATWYGPMCTPEGAPIEENIRNSEEAIRKRTGVDRGNDQYTYQTMTTVTPEQIAKFRAELADYPDALAALDEVEACDNSLDDAAEVLAIETGYTKSTLAESDQSYLDKLTEKARDVICSKYTDDVLELFKDLREFIPFPGSLAALVAIKVTQIGVDKFCESSESEA